MSLINVRDMMATFGLSRKPARRKARLTQLLGAGAEHLEGRALLSASGKGKSVQDDAAAEVAVEGARSRKRDPVTFPDVSGTWTIEVQGEVNGTGTVVVTQGGKNNKVVTASVNIPELGTFDLVDKFKKKNAFQLDGKSPRMEFPGAPIRLRLRVIINFPEGEQNPTTFTGEGRLPFVGQVVTLSAIKNV